VQDKIGGNTSFGFFGALVFFSEELDLLELFDDNCVFFSEDDDFLKRGIEYIIDLIKSF
jgi:hypothetical protein